MKKLDERYWKIVRYTVLGVALSAVALIAVALFSIMILNISTTLSSISGAVGVIIKILAPFVFGLVFAYLFDPVVEFLQLKYENFEEKHFPDKKEKKLAKMAKKGIEPSPYKKRMAGTSLLYLIMIAIIAVLIFIILGSFNIFNESEVPLTTYLISTISSTATYISNMNEQIQRKLIEIGVSDYFLTAVNTVFSWLGGLTLSIVSFVVSIAQGLFVGFIGLVMGFYLLVDKDVMKQKTIHVMNVFIPDRANERILGFFSEVNNTFSGYIRGQLMDATIYGTMVTIALSILGMPYAPFIGFLSGFCNLIPYVGAFVAFTLSITIGLFSGTPILALYAAIAIFALQQFDSVYVYPKCVASNIDISPLLVILALSVGGSLFGVIGMLFAVPVTSLCKVMLGKFIESQEKNQKIKTLLTHHKDEN